MSASDREALQDLERLFRQIESTGKDGDFAPALLERAKTALLALKEHPRIEISKLSQISDHLRPGMSLRTLMDFLVPLERALERNLRDDDFLIADRDTGAPTDRKTSPLRFVLDHWRSSFNVGSAFRSADGLGIEHIHLAGYTPTPVHTKTARSALGAEAIVPWSHHESTKDCLELLRKEGYRLVAFETAKGAVPLESRFQKAPTALIFGNERFGLSADLLAHCDEVRVLPLEGMKNSLNAAVIAALAAYEWKKQWNSKP